MLLTIASIVIQCRNFIPFRLNIFLYPKAKSVFR